MIIPDTNLLLYAFNSKAKNHAKAKTWWESCLAGDEPVGLTLPVIFAFIRVITNPKAYEQPVAVEEAIRIVRSWLSRSCVSVVDSGTVESVLELLEELGTGGNLVTDAQVAAAGMAAGGTVHTADADFRRFKGLKAFYPLDASIG